MAAPGRCDVTGSVVLPHLRSWQGAGPDDPGHEWQLPPRPLVADSGYGDCTLFRLGLTERGLSYVVEVDPRAVAQPAEAMPVALGYTGRGRPPKPAYPDPPVSLKQLVLRTGRATARQVIWRRGTRKTTTNRQAVMRSHFLALRVRLANRDILRADEGSLPEEWLIVERPPSQPGPVKYWLSNMDKRTSLKTLVRLAKIR